VQCVVTSPPYWGLRDYGTAQWEDGNEDCDHMVDRYSHNGVSEKQATNKASGNKLARDACPKCGAKRIDNQIGLEATPEEYVQHIVEIFREIRRVLRDDGTLWLNLGDSYAGSGKGGGGGSISERGNHVEKMGGGTEHRKYGVHSGVVPQGLKPKDLVGIPWMVAFALRNDGWYLRSDIIWQKLNPMPESVRDRPTTAHEYIFFFTKSRRYFYDQDAVREPHQKSTKERIKHGLKHTHPADANVAIPPVNTKRMGERFAHILGRNLRTVWTFALQPFKGAHFATFPEKLVETPIKAGTSELGACAKCGAPFKRITKKSQPPKEIRNREEVKMAYHTQSVGGGQIIQDWYDANPAVTVDWESTCNHELSIAPCVVMDPFAGSGTVGVVAEKYGRDFVGIELNPEYAQMALDRIDGARKRN